MQRARVPFWSGNSALTCHMVQPKKELGTENNSDVSSTNRWTGELAVRLSDHEASSEIERTLMNSDRSILNHSSEERSQGPKGKTCRARPALRCGRPGQPLPQGCGDRLHGGWTCSSEDSAPVIPQRADSARLCLSRVEKENGAVTAL